MPGTIKRTDKETSKIDTISMEQAVKTLEEKGYYVKGSVEKMLNDGMILQSIFFYYEKAV